MNDSILVNNKDFRKFNVSILKIFINCIYSALNICSSWLLLSDYANSIPVQSYRTPLRRISFIEAL